MAAGWCCGLKAVRSAVLMLIFIEIKLVYSIIVIAFLSRQATLDYIAVWALE